MQKRAKAKAKKSASGIKSAFGGLGKIFTPFNIGVASAIGALTGLTLGIKDNIAHFDKLIKTARQVGLPVEQFSALTFAADQSGISIDELGRGFRNMARNVAGGSAQFTEALSAIGISFEQFAGLSQQERLLLLADKFSSLRESGNKTAIAMRILGEEMGPRFINLLNNGRDGLTAYIDEADRLGVTIDENTAKAAEKFNDNLDRLSRNIKSVAQSIAAKILPALADMSDKLVEISNFDFSGWLDKVAGKLGIDLSEALGKVNFDFQQFAIWVTGGTQALLAYRRQVGLVAKEQQILGELIAKNQRVNRSAKGDRLDIVPLPGRGDRKRDAPSLPGSSSSAGRVKTPDELAALDEENHLRQRQNEIMVAARDIQQSFQTPEEKRIERLKLLNEALAQGRISHEEYARAARLANSQVTAAYASIASNVVGSLGQVFSKSKGFAIAQALIDTYSAFNSALANPPGPPFSYAQAAAALASGIARVNAIKSTSPGSSGGTASGGAATAGGGQMVQAAPKQAVNLTLHGQRFSRDDVVSLINQMNDVISDGAILKVRAV